MSKLNLLRMCRIPIVLWLMFGLAAGVAAQKPQTGQASFYHTRFEGRKTANGEVFKQMGMTAAHRTLPLGTWVKVTNLKNFRAAIVRINDRGPYIRGKIIDLTQRAAFEIGLTHQQGHVKVMIEVIDHPGPEKELLKTAPAMGTRHLFKIQMPKPTPSF